MLSQRWPEIRVYIRVHIDRWYNVPSNTHEKWSGAS